MKLRAKTVLLLVAVVSAILVGAGILSLHYEERSLKDAIVKGVDSQAKSTAHGISLFIDDSLREADAIARTMPLQALLEGKTSEIEKHFKKMLAVFPKFQNGIFLLDRDGLFLADYPSHRDLRGASFAFREYYRRTIREKRGIVGETYESKRTARPVITFTAPVYDAGGGIIAVVACSVDLLSEDALGKYRAQKFGNTGYIFVFDTSRRLILHPDATRILTQVEQGKNRIMDNAVNGFEGSGETINSQGVPMLLSIRKIANAPWFVAAQVSAREAYQPITDARTRIIAISLIVIGIVIVLGILAGRRIIRPLVKLQRAAFELSRELEAAEKDHAYIIPDSVFSSVEEMKSRDEIGTLTSSFLRLTEKLKEVLASLQRSSEDWERTFNAVHEAVVTLDRDGKIIMMNRAALDWFRTSESKSRGKTALEVIFGDGSTPAQWLDESMLANPGKISWSQHMRNPQGIFEFTIMPVTASGHVSGWVLVINDITKRVQFEEHIREMAFYDQLTGLPNRILLHDRIRQAIALTRRTGRKTGIMFLDLDHFKKINDLHGHDVGDAVLKRVAEQVELCLRENDTLARIGGDEFVIVLQDIESLEEATAVARRILEVRSRSIEVNSAQLRVGVSIGIAVFPDDAQDEKSLVKYADTAMYRAKEQGRGNYQIFSELADEGSAEQF